MIILPQIDDKIKGGAADMKKIGALLLALAVAAMILTLCACGGGDPTETSEKVPTAYTGPTILLPEV